MPDYGGLANFIPQDLERTMRDHLVSPVTMENQETDWLSTTANGAAKEIPTAN